MVLIDKLTTSQLKLGIIAGGQLGKMIIQEASKWGIETAILDPNEECSARGVATAYTKGDFRDFDTVYAFGKSVDVLTYELEDINIEALYRLQNEGVAIYPQPEVLAHIQDKGLQKAFYVKHDLPTSPFRHYANAQEIVKAVKLGELTYPFVQKLCRGGYDGHGVKLMYSATDSLLEGESIVEQKIDIAKEIAVIVARSAQGEVVSYPVVEMYFNHESNLVEQIESPASLTNEQEAKAKQIAQTIIEKFGMVGLLAVEFFIDTRGEVLINEVAPRPHNSGHHTIEGMVTSQYQQLLYAILDLPLGSTERIKSTVTFNLLGEKGHDGVVVYEGFKEALALGGVNIHLYGKKETRPHRKMGHVTIVANSLKEAQDKAKEVKSMIKVKSCQKK
jgi:5-(carboxyamino)imidazole ribonucleotide synthase